MVSVPQVGQTYLRDVTLGSGPHAGDDADASAPCFANQVTLGLYGVDGIHNEVGLRLVEQSRDIICIHVLHLDVQLHIGIDVTETTGQHLSLCQSDGGVKGRQLTVDVTRLHGVGIHQCQVPDTRPAKHLGSIGPHATYPHHQYVGGTKAFVCFLSKKLRGALLPVEVPSNFPQRGGLP